MPITARVDVATPSHRYPILIGPGLLREDESWNALPRARHAVVVSNTTVHPLHGMALEDRLAQSGFGAISRVLLPDGEVHKDWATLQSIYDHLLERECDRKTVLFALGGGVVGDITGFAAATYMRGVPFVQVPTTLLAQVDSSVGGKTAINHPLGKNMIGAFYQPERVVIDLDTLATLPDREYASGLAEVIKYGPIADAGFLDWVEANLDALLARDPAALAHAVRRSCEIKAEVVGADEREAGLRAILNFGHTFGHAIEGALGFGAWLHGEAVACGMVLGARLSSELGLVPATFVDRLERLMARAGLPVRAPALTFEEWMRWMRVDKKAEGGTVRFVVIEAVGRAATRPAADDLVRRVIDQHSEPHGAPSSNRASGAATAA